MEHPPQRRRFERTRPTLVFGLSLSLSAVAKISPAWGSLHSSYGTVRKGTRQPLKP